MAGTENYHKQGEILSPKHSGPASVNMRKAYLTRSGELSAFRYKGKYGVISQKALQAASVGNG